MLETIKDAQGNLKAVCEYYSVSSSGEWDANGIYCWINEVEVSPQYRNNGCLKEFIKKITTKYPRFQYGYFWRQYKYKGRAPRIYTRRQWLKLVKKES